MSWQITIGHGQFGIDPDNAARKDQHWFIRRIDQREAPLMDAYRCNTHSEPNAAWELLRSELEISEVDWVAFFSTNGCTALEPEFLSLVQRGVRKLEFKLGETKAESHDHMLQLGYWLEYWMSWAFLECRNPMLVYC